MVDNMERTETTDNLSPIVVSAAIQSARHQANIAKWNLNAVILLFAFLTAIIILTSYGVGIAVVAPLAVFGLAIVWFLGWKRWNKTYPLFYNEALLRMQEKPSENILAYLSGLSSQELSILDYISKGYINKQIAARLSVSESTVKNHVTSILSKLDANDRTEAVVIAIRNGLIAVN